VTRARGPAATRGKGRRQWADDQGTASALSLVLGTGLIVLPVLVLVLSVPAWEQRAVDAQDAARAAARALATASTWDQGVSSADQSVAEVETGDGLAPSDVAVDYAGTLSPGASVTATVTVAIPVGDLPGLGFIGTLHYSATSTEHVDSYRSYGSGG